MHAKREGSGQVGVSQIKMGAVLSYTAIGVHFLVTLLYTPVMLRLLGQAEYGLYSLTASIVSYLSLLSFGFGSAYIRFYSRYMAAENHKGVKRLNGLFLALFSTIGVVAVAAGTVLALNVRAVLGAQNFSAAELDTARVLFLIMVVNLAITFPTSVFSSYIFAHERFILQKTLEIIRLILGPFVILPILFLGYGSIGLAAATAGLNVLFSAYTFWYAVTRLGMRFTLQGFDWSLFREISVFSGYIFINMVVDQVNWNVDKFIIGRLHGAVPVAVYGVAALLNTSFLQFSTALSGLFVPRVNRMVAEARPLREINDLFLRVGRLQFLVLALVASGFVVFGHSFVRIWAGEEYGGAYVMGLWLMLPLVVPLIQNVGIEIQRALNLHKFRSWAYVVFAAVNIAITIPLTMRFGAVGAAAATGAVMLVGNGVVMNMYYHLRVGLDIKEFWGQIARMSVGLLPAAAAGTLILSLVDLSQPWLMVGAGVLFILVYGVGMWTLGMNEDERWLLRGAIRRRVPGRR